jgi:hypothetical protein
MVEVRPAQRLGRAARAAYRVRPSQGGGHFRVRKRGNAESPWEPPSVGPSVDAAGHSRSGFIPVFLFAFRLTQW